MPTKNILKQAGTTSPPLDNLPNAAGIVYNTDDGFVYYDDAGSARTVVNEEETQTITGNKTFSGTTTLSGSTTLSGATTISGTLTTTAAGQIRVVAVTITNAEFLALRGTPKSLVAAPGAGFGLQFLGGWITIDYTAAYTESADNLAVRFTDGSGAIVSGAIETTGWVDATADSYVTMVPLAQTAAPAVVNAALVLHNTGDGEFGGGNAANVITATTYYRVVTVP